ncbi:MAG: acetyl-CoA carboxylase biotin carboxyl carrier protein [Candidatus Omnitrophica bacterium]|nr:acetyl-CoA carboxylase biotin carboxyl carrier protein [Candidatus Omnitrophota bacterium]MBU4487769.1 acetyl-CoA carboxylase biotin carboxyl carrier protein [Candidatus Omnitrophota bacterium]MCG2705179.1 acetyl-CoA carboxylase biotin carboxyl carrier protein [Candidatus Omnitrophota bacterium]
MNIKEIKEVINLMNDNGLTEIELEKDGLKIRLVKGREGMIETSVLDRGAEKAIPASSVRQMQSEQAAALVKSKNLEIKSPMVGTFYASPSPDAPPFVKVGDNVALGQVVCIIEAMKLMNEIKSEIKGKVAAVLVENADPVEFSQTLFLVEPV